MIDIIALLVALILILIALLIGIFAWAMKVWGRVSPLVASGQGLISKFTNKDGSVKMPTMEEAAATMALSIIPDIKDDVVGVIKRGLGKLFADKGKGGSGITIQADFEKVPWVPQPLDAPVKVEEAVKDGPA